MACRKFEVACLGAIFRKIARRPAKVFDNQPAPDLDWKTGEIRRSYQSRFAAGGDCGLLVSAFHTGTLRQALYFVGGAGSVCTCKLDPSSTVSEMTRHTKVPAPSSFRYTPLVNHS